MNVFVTGASGYIGFAVATALARVGHEVYGLVRSPEKAGKLAAAEVRPVPGSMDEPASYEAAARRCQVLVHCAAENSARKAELERTTVDTLVRIASEAALPRKLIVTSGVWVYGDTGTQVVDEGSPLAAPPFTAMRVPLEEEVLAANRGRLKTLVIRPGGVYGGAGGLTAAWFESALKEGAARVVGDGSFRWSMVHVSDLADLYVRAVESPLGGEVFNATDRSRFTVLECATAASLAAGAGGAVRTVLLEEASQSMGPFATCLAMNQHVDSSKAARLLGWEPRHAGFVDGVGRYYAAWKVLSS